MSIKIMFKPVIISKNTNFKLLDWKYVWMQLQKKSEPTDATKCCSGTYELGAENIST